MTRLAAVLRLLVLAVFTAGLGLPATSLPTSPGDAPPMTQSCHDGAATTMPMAMTTAQDESCRQHCLGIPLPVAPAEVRFHIGRLATLFQSTADEDAPSRAPQPEGHPPRA